MNETHYSSAAFTTLSVAKVVERQWQISELLCTVGSRSQRLRGLRRGSASALLLGLRVRIPLEDECFSVVSVVCCQVEVSASGWSLVQRRHTDCGVSECDRESSIWRRPWLARVCGDKKKKSIGGAIADRGKPKYSEKNLSQCQFVHHHSHMS